MFSASPLIALLNFFIKKGQRLLCIFKQWKRGSDSYLLSRGLTTDWCVGFSELAFFFCNNVGKLIKQILRDELNLMFCSL